MKKQIKNKKKEKTDWAFIRKIQKKIESGEIRISLYGFGGVYELSDLAGMCDGKDMGLSFGGRDVKIVDGKKKVYYSGSQQEAKDDVDHTIPITL